MRNSSVLVGLLFGLVVSGILVVPLALDLPGRLVPRWPEVNPGGALAAWFFSILVPVVAGFVAGRINPDEAVRAGSGSGTVAGLVASSLVVVPAAGVWSAGPLYLASQGGRLSAGSTEELLAEALVRSAWAPGAAAAFAVLVALGAGALGGFLAEVSSHGSRSREVHRSAVPMTALLAVGLGVTAQGLLAAHAEHTLLPALHQPVGFLSRFGLMGSLAGVIVVDTLLLSWTIRDAALLWRSGRRAGALGWGGLALGLVGATHLTLLGVYPYAFLSPWPWLALGAEAFVVVSTLWMHRGSVTVLAEAPRHWFELAIEGLEMGLVSTSVFLIAGGGTASVWAVQLLPTAWAMVQGLDELPFDPRAAVTQQFLVHLAAPVPAVVIACTYAVLATPLWLLGLAMVRRAETRRS